MNRNPRLSSVGDPYVLCADLELLANDDIDKARDLLEKARELGCSNMGSYYSTRGFMLWRAGEREEGIAELERSVALNPTVTHLVRLGRVLSADGDARATEVWQRVLKQDATNCLAHIYIGIGAVKSGNRGQAMLMAKRSERLARSGRDYSEIGRLYQELGEFHSAIGAYLEGHRLDDEPKGPLYAAIAACYFSLGDNSNGRRYLQWAMKHSPQHEYVRHVYEQSRDLVDDEVRE
jgi:tetratricopeptide (TPR) repeat protein